MSESPIVEIPLGKLQGFTIDLENNEKADIFLNIPYAKPPVGELRFEKPQLPEPWSGIREAKSYGPTSIPHDTYSGWGVSEDVSEDSLTFNVYKPHKKSDSKDGYPVLVWVHGGGFNVGSVPQTGYEKLSKNLLPKGVIIVDFQYRLGPLGFLTMGDDVLPGNYGYWDMAAALKFIHANIKFFGGNPNKVTAWGISAGGAAVSALSISPHSRDYIHQTIEMSGSPLAAWASNERVLEVSKEFLKSLNIDTKNSHEVKKLLKEKPIEEILQAMKKTTKAEKGINFNHFQPHVDGDFFPEDYLELIKKSPPKPAIIGFTDVEAVLFTLAVGAEGTNFIPYNQQPKFGEEDLKKFIHDYVAPKEKFGDKAGEVQEKLFEFYVLRNKPASADYKFYLERYAQLHSDTEFIVPVIWTALEKMKNGWPVYLYQNEHYNKTTFPEDAPVKGTLHGSEHVYLHEYILVPFEFDEDDKKFQNFLIESVTNFVHTGDPSSSSLNWPKITPDHNLRYARLKANPEVKEPLLEDRLDFWTGLAKNYSYNIIRGAFN